MASNSPYFDVPTRILKRAQYEAFAFEYVEGDVRVRNESYADPENHEYLVEIEDGLPVSCPCPADKHYDNACKHRVAVAMRRPILDFANEAKLVADGGSTTRERRSATSSLDELGGERRDTEDDLEDCDCDDLHDAFPCWECYRIGRQTFG